MIEIIGEIRDATPEEIKEWNRNLANKEEIEEWNRNQANKEGNHAR